jgi:atypical dual specificity phosphatase
MSQEPTIKSHDSAFPAFGRMPTGLRRFVVRLLFHPTLWWNRLLHRALPSRRWWDRIDAHVLLGALPIEHVLPELQAEGVRAVVNLCEEFPGPVEAYARMGIEQLHLPTIDFSPPTLADIERGVAFIQAHAGKGETVYVHCKAGRGRSATVVICWLVKTNGLSPTDAERFVRERRPHIAHGLHRRREVLAFYEHLSAKR